MTEVQSKPLRLGGVEAGGTTFAVSLALDTPTNVIEQISIPTTTPDETLARVIQQLCEWKVDAIGIGSFGPVDLNTSSETYGYITTTPKPHWQQTAILSTIKKGVESGLELKSIPVGFTTDVNAAALAEMHYGGHGDISSCAYVTIGTGIGVGIVTNNLPIEGLTHPEAGHIRVLRHDHDSFPGVCPFHGDCLEGLATANACAAKLGVSVEELPDIEDTHPVWEMEANYLGQLCATLTLMVSPHVIVIGGGVAKRESLFPKIRDYMLKNLNGYIASERILKETDLYIKPSILNASDSNTTAGAVGALYLAYQAHSKVSKL